MALILVSVVKIRFFQMDEVELNAVYAIPLDVADVIDTRSFSRLRPENISTRFAFCLVIGLKSSIGMKVIFSDVVSEWTGEVDCQIFERRLLHPEVVSFSVVKKKRWRRIRCANADSLSYSESQSIELPVAVYFGSQVEKMILKELCG